MNHLTGGLMKLPPRTRGTVSISDSVRLPRCLFGACLLLALSAIASSAQTFTDLVNFDRNTDGAQPAFLSLAQGIDGNLYGTTSGGGTYKQGTFFKVTPTGKLTILYSFCPQSNCPDGFAPQSTLAVDLVGNFYGVTPGGGAQNQGTIFRVTPKGKLTTLYSFCALINCADGQIPTGGLVRGIDGNFYGTTKIGGPNKGFGTIFRITPRGKLTTLHTFTMFQGDGGYPTAALIQVPDGVFYGTTMQGGTYGVGTVFKMTPRGMVTTLYSFCALTNCDDGGYPFAGLVQAADGSFYGTTVAGGVIGAGGPCNNYPPNGCGTVFKITAAGKVTTLYSFCALANCADDGDPYGVLVQATDGKFYGTTSGGPYTTNYGTIFDITSGGALTTLHNFDFTGGAGPFGGFVQATSGIFYGTTYAGGTNGDGTIFSLSVGFHPFVETLPTSGKVGAPILILGNNLKGSTAVSFHGTAAKFTVVSNSEIKTTVPVGATTGTVEVKTLRKTLKSDVAFHVTR
jgi:uncharacterized repeat protein (TIGR03803 family)